MSNWAMRTVVTLPLAEPREMVLTQFWVSGTPVVFEHPIDMTRDEWDRFFAMLELAKPGVVAQQELSEFPVEEALAGDVQKGERT